MATAAAIAATATMHNSSNDGNYHSKNNSKWVYKQLITTGIKHTR